MGQVSMEQTIKMPVQNVSQVKDTWQHNTMHFLQDNGIGFLVLLGFAGVGVLTIFRKKIKAWLK